MQTNENTEFAGYQVPKGEENMYHCVIEQKQFDASTGQRLSRPVVQKFGKKFFETFGMHQLKQQGYTITILHNPNDVHEEAEPSKDEQAAAEPKKKKVNNTTKKKPKGQS